MIQAGWRRNGPHAAVLLGVASLYIVVRIVVAPQIGFWRFHATDLLAGIALPSLMAIVFAPATPLGAWARTLPGKLALTASATLVWEVMVPLATSRSTPDWIDALCYIAGTLVQHVIVGRR